jgi:PII-like signaling protein
MLAAGPAVKVSIYLNADTGAAKAFLYQDLLSLLQTHGIDGASVFKMHAGFGSHGRLHIDGAGSVEGEHLPILICVIDTEEKIAGLMPELLAAVTDGLVEAHPTQILKVVQGSSRVIV